MEKYDDSPSNKANLKSSNRGGGAPVPSSSNPQARPTQGSKSNAPSSYRHSTPDANQLSKNNQSNTASSTNFPRSQVGGNQNNNQISPNSAPPGSNHFPTSSQTNPQGQRSTNSAPAVAVQPPGPRTWMDKLGDALLGADPSQMTAEQRYALICEACYAHNGLALKEEIEEIREFHMNERERINWNFAIVHFSPECHPILPSFYVSISQSMSVQDVAISILEGLRVLQFPHLSLEGIESIPVPLKGKGSIQMQVDSVSTCLV